MVEDIYINQKLMSTDIHDGISLQRKFDLNSELSAKSCSSKKSYSIYKSLAQQSAFWNLVVSLTIANKKFIAMIMAKCSKQKSPVLAGYLYSYNFICISLFDEEYRVSP